MAKPTPRGDIASYERARFEYDGVAHDVYRKGQGPAVIVIPEMPGASPQLFGFADRVVAIGCSVVVPHLFGPANVDVTTLPVPLRALAHLRSVTQVCVSREFNVFASGRSSPVTHWLRGLAAHEHDRCGGPGVGVVGMCFTGGFALALASDPRVLAPVLSQPSLPVGGSPRSIDCDKLTLAAVAQRCAKEDLEVLGLRFKGDALSPLPALSAAARQAGRRLRRSRDRAARRQPQGPLPAAPLGADGRCRRRAEQPDVPRARASAGSVQAQAAALMALRIGERHGALLVDVQVSPRASKSALLGEHDGCLKLALAAPPVDGAANRALIELLSALLGVPRKRIELVHGESSKRKTVALHGVTREAIEALLRAV
jgi:uncharacterized protein (TIGR00251 family)